MSKSKLLFSHPPNKRSRYGDRFCFLEYVLPLTKVTRKENIFEIAAQKHAIHVHLLRISRLGIELGSDVSRQISRKLVETPLLVDGKDTLLLFSTAIV